MHPEKHTSKIKQDWWKSWNTKHWVHRGLFRHVYQQQKKFFFLSTPPFETTPAMPFAPLHFTFKLKTIKQSKQSESEREREREREKERERKNLS